MRIRLSEWWLAICVVCVPALRDNVAAAQATPPARVIELRYTPVGRAQIAIWIEDAAGKYLTTVGLTDAVATRGIGNRPGASQMNSGFRWPYGRREGVLPIWAHRRVAAEGQRPFRRVIFQNRLSEGNASRNSDANDFSVDDYFCLSFDRKKSAQDALDAVSCASVFTSDKGRFMTEDDKAGGYGEPYEDLVAHAGNIVPLSLTSPYPPRRDVKGCGAGCYDHADVAQYREHARDVLPEIDEITMATPPSGELARKLYTVPDAWRDGDYRVCLEINVEGDYNASFNPQSYPMPTTPSVAWDDWAVRNGFGYPYRGQPSVVYCLQFGLGGDSEQTFATDEPAGSAGTWDTVAPDFGALASMQGMTDDAQHARGSGADRLMRSQAGARLTALVRPAEACGGNHAPTPVDDLVIERYADELHAHEWATLQFRAAADDAGIFRYDVRVSSTPIVDDVTFMQAQPGTDATRAAEELRVPTEAAAGSTIRVEFGGLMAQTHYFVGVRAVDACGAAGELRVGEIVTPQRVFATVSPCFVATAAYGTPLAREVSALRRLRDRQLANHELGRALIDAYWRVGPTLAAQIRGDERLRALARGLLSPLVAAARLLDETP